MSEEAGFVVDLEGFEGPLDLLLDLARANRIDLTTISMVELADQYLDYLEVVLKRRLELAAEYLVMAAWLSYLKSRLLLPPPHPDDPEAADAAEALAARLRRLDAIRRAAAWLVGRPRLGELRLARGAAEPPMIQVEPRWHASLAELLAAYGRTARREAPAELRLPARRLLSVEEAIEQLCRNLTGCEWHDLAAFLPAGLDRGVPRRAAIAANLVAGLELARTGVIELEQAAPFAPIMVRRH